MNCTTLPLSDAKFEQFAMDAVCTPCVIRSTDFADQISNLTQKDRSAGLAMAHLPGPEQAKADTMPGNNRLWFDDGQCRTRITP